MAHGSLCPSVTVLTMSLWSWRHISESEYAARKVLKRYAQRTTPFLSSSTCKGWSWCMAGGATDACAGSFYTTSGRISCLCLLSWHLRWRMGSAVRFSLRTGSRRCTMLCGRVGSVSLHSRLNRTSMTNTFMSIRRCTQLASRARTSDLRSSGGGLCSLFGMVVSSTQALFTDCRGQLTRRAWQTRIGGLAQLHSLLSSTLWLLSCLWKFSSGITTWRSRVEQLSSSTTLACYSFRLS